MCGKNRNKFAHYAFNLLDLQYVKLVDFPLVNNPGESELLTLEDFKNDVPHSKLLHEMLVALIFLLFEFYNLPARNDNMLNPWKTDILMNLIVIFSKIIKQSPENCTAIGKALKEIYVNKEAKIDGFHSSPYQAERLFGEYDLYQALQFLLIESDSDILNETDPSLSMLLNLMTQCQFILMRLG